MASEQMHTPTMSLSDTNQVLMADESGLMDIVARRWSTTVSGVPRPFIRAAGRFPRREEENAREPLAP